jgi:Uma2 family endonuclease
MAVQKAPPEPETFTVQDFFALIADGRKADLIDGGIFVASPDTPRNNLLANFIQFLLDGFADRNSSGRVVASRVAFVLDEFNSPEPDVAFVSRERLDIFQESRAVGGPDIAVEVVSRDSRHRDYVDKKRLYESAEVREYWIIDRIKKSAEFHRLQDGTYVPVPLERSRIFRSETLPGFWLDVEWLFADPLPSKLECLQRVLAGEPAE